MDFEALARETLRHPAFFRGPGVGPTDEQVAAVAAALRAAAREAWDAALLAGTTRTAARRA